MTVHLCACGYEADSPEDLADHIAEAFIPSDDVAPDGVVHAELAGNPRACLCGYTAAETTGLDAHLLAAFTRADRVGRDGRAHGLRG